MRIWSSSASCCSVFVRNETNKAELWGVIRKWCWGWNLLQVIIRLSVYKLVAEIAEKFWDRSFNHKSFASCDTPTDAPHAIQTENSSATLGRCKNSYRIKISPPCRYMRKHRIVINYLRCAKKEPAWEAVYPIWISFLSWETACTCLRQTRNLRNINLGKFSYMR